MASISSRSSDTRSERESFGEPPLKNARKEPAPVDVVLRNRMRSNWPRNLKVGGAEGNPLSSLIVEHSAPHTESSWERWTISGHIGENDRYGIFASFSRSAVIDDHYPPTQAEQVTYSCCLNWVVFDRKCESSEDGKKYFSFSELDHRTPVLASALLAQGGGVADKELAVALAEQLNHNRVPLPDVLMSGPSSMSINTLDLNFNGCTLKALPRKAGQSRGFPRYQLHLESSTNSSATPAGDGAVKAVVDIVFCPTKEPVLLGNAGVVSDGDWENDLFSYAVPHCDLLSGSVRIVREKNDFELARDLEINVGRIYMGHEFGGALPRTVDEAEFIRHRRQQRRSTATGHGIPGVAPHNANAVWELCAVRLSNASRDTVTILTTRDPKSPEQPQPSASDSENMNGKPSSTRKCITYAVIQSKETGETTYRSEEVEWVAKPEKQYRSPSTGALFHTSWKLAMPLHKDERLEITIKAAHPAQEFITLPAKAGYWEGSVTVDGVIKVNNGENQPDTLVPVNGIGFMESRGKGSVGEWRSYLSMMHQLTCVAMEAPEVARYSSPDAIAQGPAIDPISSAILLANQQQQPMQKSVQVLLATLLGTYGFIFHHSQEQDAVREALSWCHGKWLSYYGTTPLDTKTLLFRAFMIRTLRKILTDKCSSWVKVEDYDRFMMILPAWEIISMGTPIIHSYPTLEEIQAPISELSINRLKSLLQGHFTLKANQTPNLSSFLAAQGVSVLWRNYILKSNPSLNHEVDVKNNFMKLSYVSTLGSSTVRVAFDGSEWEWVRPGVGRVSSRACALDGGKELYIETLIHSTGNVERKWYTFHKDGKELEIIRQHYPSQGQNVTPIATCTQTYLLGIPSSGSSGGGGGANNNNNASSTNASNNSNSNNATSSGTTTNNNNNNSNSTTAHKN